MTSAPLPLDCKHSTEGKYEERRGRRRRTTTRLNLTRVKEETNRNEKGSTQNDGVETEKTDALLDDPQGEASKDGREDVRETKG